MGKSSKTGCGLNLISIYIAWVFAFESTVAILMKHPRSEHEHEKLCRIESFLQLVEEKDCGGGL